LTAVLAGGRAVLDVWAVEFVQAAQLPVSPQVRYWSGELAHVVAGLIPSDGVDVIKPSRVVSVLTGMHEARRIWLDPAEIELS
jgi:hypothetical protein